MAGDQSRIPEYFQRYSNNVQEEDLMNAFKNHQPQFIEFFKNIPEEKWNYRYAEGKWSIKEMVQHLIDTERVFQYRALCFARKDKTNLPSFDENLFASNADAERRTKDNLLREFEVTLQSGLLLFQSFTEEQLEASGVANGKSVYVRGMGFIMLGHVMHHIGVLKERYLQ
jgi:uncharacterized damage-inducible protein DinB